MNRKIKFSVFVCLSAMLVGDMLWAQTSGPPPPPPPTPPPGLPVDGAVLILFLVALFFGIYKSIKLSKKFS